jgi:cytochrome P450
MIATDPPRHAELRAVIAKRVSPGVLRPAGEYIEHRADQTVAEMLAAEKCDVGAIARNFVVDVVGELVGLPAELAGEMAAWGEAAFDAAGPPNARCLAALPTLQKMDAGLSSLEEEDFRPGSLGRVAYEAARLGVIGLDEVVDVLHNFTKPSIDSTIAALATAIWQLSVSPQQWKLLRDDTTRAVAACNEALRFDAPVQMFTRVVQDECTIGGLTLRDGERVIMMFGSANRDERHYKDPDRFDLERNPTDHLAFGHGVHTCVGAPLARLEISKLLSAMAQRIQTLEADNEPTWRIGNLVRQIETMTIAVR